MSYKSKQFRTPEMAERYLGHSTEPEDVDWSALPEASAHQDLTATAMGIERSTRRAHSQRKRIPYGHAIPLHMKVISTV
jgi:hypothetical protein